MAQSQTGKWVSRVASTGGGRTYRQQRPTGFYAAIAAIVVLGLLSVAWARHDYKSSASSTTSPKVTPAVGTTSYAALGFNVCGTTLPSLAPSTQTAPIMAQEDGVLKLAPKTASEAGFNSTLELFQNDYKGLTISDSKLVLPNATGGGSATYTDGETCPSGTPDAGKAGYVVLGYWKNFAVTSPTIEPAPAAVHISSNALVTVGFLPKGAKPPKPSSTTIDRMLAAASTSSTTTTAATSTTAGSTSTTAASTTTSAASTSTTAASSTTTTKAK